MKKFFAVFLVLALCCSFMVSCGTEETSAADNTSAETETTEAEQEEQAEEETAAQVEEEAEEEEEEEAETETESSETASDQEAEETAESESEEETTDPLGGLTLPLVDDGSVTLTMLKEWSSNLQMVVDDPMDTTFMQEMEARTGIHVEVTATADYATEFSLMTASDSYYDLFYAVTRYYSGGVETALADSVLIDFAEYMEEGYMPNFAATLEEYPSIASVCYTSSGQIGELVGLSSDAINGSTRDDTIKGMYIRADYLEAIGKDAPVTYDEYYEVLTLFKTELGVEYPFYLADGGIPQLDKMISGYGTLGYFTGRGSPFYVDDGTVCFGPIQEGYKEYLEMMAKWYAEGLINQDFYSVTNSDAESDFINGLYGTYMDNDNSMHIYENMATDESFKLVAIADGTPDETYTDYVERVADLTWNNGWSVAASCEYPELACQWFDYLYSEEGSILMNYGVENEGFTYVDGEPVLTDLVLNNPDGLVTNNALSIYAGYMMPGIVDSDKLLPSYTEAELAAADIWYPEVNSTKTTLPDSVSMTDEENAIYSQVIADIQTAVNEYTLKVITGQETTDGFDEYVANIEAMNIADAVAAKQSAYDRYLASKN